MNNLNKINHANLKYLNKPNNNFNSSKRNRIEDNENINFKRVKTNSCNFKINQFLPVLFILFNLICFATCQVRYTSMKFILFHQTKNITLIAFFQNTKGTICADDYKVNSYSLDCPPGQGVNIVGAQEFFAYQSAFPECTNDGYRYNLSKPFSDYCKSREACVISPAFLDESLLFNADTYFLPDRSLYNIPFRIDVTYECLSKFILCITLMLINYFC